MIITASRYHDFSYGHRVCGHENKCGHLHGHNGRVHFTVTAHKLDMVGRVLDFSVINTRLCQWVEEQWDHKFLVYRRDPWADQLIDTDPMGVVPVEFNPTAENMAKYLLKAIGPLALDGTNCTLVKVIIEETRKCSAGAEL